MKDKFDNIQLELYFKFKLFSSITIEIHKQNFVKFLKNSIVKTLQSPIQQTRCSLCWQLIAKI